MDEVFVSVPAIINKSNPGEIDSDGNYTFEVEASNENLDLQNQIVQQKALIKSKEYFLTNGIISDDHQHKKRLDDGTVESDKTKIIGEPISVWTDGKRTFVKGKLYGNVQAAKPFITLLKAGSSRVKASVGGIMPKVKMNDDGSETVTSFMWNDLALTCSPVNSTVGSAVFAKSLTNLEFCKSLSASTETTDSAEKTGGAAIVPEDAENKITNVAPVNYIQKADDDEENEEEEKVKDAVGETMAAISTGELKTKKSMLNFLMERGFTLYKSQEIVDEIIDQGEKQMAKSHFLENFGNIMKSLSGKKDCAKSDLEEDPKDENLLAENQDTDNNDEDTPKSEEDPKDDNDDDVEKSLMDGEEMVDGTEIIKSMLSDQEDLKKSNDEVIDRLAGLEKSIMQLAETVVAIANQPQARRTVMNKSIVDGGIAAGNGEYQKPNEADLDLFKGCLCNAFKEGDISLEKSTHLESAFQKAMKGIRMNPNDEKEVRKIFAKYN